MQFEKKLPKFDDLFKLPQSPGGEVSLLNTQISLTLTKETIEKIQRIKKMKKNSKEGNKISLTNFVNYLVCEFNPFIVSTSYLPLFSSLHEASDQKIGYYLENLSNEDHEVKDMDIYPKNIFNVVDLLMKQGKVEKKTYTLSSRSKKLLQLCSEHFQISRNLLVESLFRLFFIEEEFKKNQLRESVKEFPKILKLIEKFYESGEDTLKKLGDILSERDPIYNMFHFIVIEIDLLTNNVREITKDENSLESVGETRKLITRRLDGYDWSCSPDFSYFGEWAEENDE